jgi:hypothetical protein
VSTAASLPVKGACSALVVSGGCARGGGAGCAWVSGAPDGAAPAPAAGKEGTAFGDQITRRRRAAAADRCSFAHVAGRSGPHVELLEVVSGRQSLSCLSVSES